MDPYIILGSAVIGFLVGMTGAGGGALMTPMLILLFGVTPSTAISSDLVAAVVMRPIGAVVHLRKRTVNLGLVRWMVIGSVPLAIAGTYILHLLGHSKEAEDNVRTALGVALLIGAAAMVLRYVLDRRAGQRRLGVVHDITVRPVPTVVIGMIGGLIVGMTSVGAGSLMIVLLLFLYPVLGASQLVGTDLTQAVPLTLAAALGALAFGHVELSVTASLVVGSVPAVFIGSMLSASAPDRYLRPVITFVILASGLKYVGLGTVALGWALCGVLLGAGALWLAYVRPWRADFRAPGTAQGGDVGHDATVPGSPRPGRNSTDMRDAVHSPAPGGAKPGLAAAPRAEVPQPAEPATPTVPQAPTVPAAPEPPVPSGPPGSPEPSPVPAPKDPDQPIAPPEPDQTPDVDPEREAPIEPAPSSPSSASSPSSPAERA